MSDERQVALIRGINVGRAKRVAMSELRARAGARAALGRAGLARLERTPRRRGALAEEVLSEK